MEVLLIFLFILSIGLSGFNLWQQYQLKNHYGQFLKGASARNIEDLLKKYAKDVDKSLLQIDELAGFVAKLHKTQKLALSKVALVRYNPFGDTGGDQSFCLAILDHTDSGYIISAVHARTGTRVYPKDIFDGESKHHMSKEEAKALKEAMAQKSK